MALSFSPDFSIEFSRGDDISFTLTLLDDDDVPLDLTGVAIRSEVRSKPDGRQLFEFDVAIAVDPTTGVATFSADHGVTELLRSTDPFVINAYYDIEVTWLDGDVQTLFGPADVKILKDITLPVAP